MSAATWVAVGVSLVLILSGGGSVLATTAPLYEITVDDRVETPPRDVTFEGQTYTVRGVAKQTAENTITARVSGPDDTIYRLYLYNKDKQILDSRRATSAETFTFDLSGYEPGSYMLAVQQGGSFEAIHPILIKGYDVQVTSPTQASESATVTIDVGVTAKDGMTAPHEVEVGIGNEQKTIIETATRQSNGDYRATIELSSLSPDEYQVYAVVRGTETAFGSQELLGLSNTNTLQITKDTVTTTAKPPNNEPTDSPTATKTTPTSTSTVTTPVSETPTTGERTPSTTEATAASTTSTTDESVITPERTTTDGPTDTPDKTGLSTIELTTGAAFIALVGGGIIIALRRKY